jgi:putative membrane-bound dehydrogenase-like protein
MRRTLAVLLYVMSLAAAAPVRADDPSAPAPEGVLPVGADGQPLNLDFETGTLAGWRPEGEAFDVQPIEGDSVFSRRGDMKSNHVGRFWIGTYEIGGDALQGTLTSPVFKVTHRYAAFRVAGGPHAETCVQLFHRDDAEPFFQVSGSESEDLRPVVIDLASHQGQEVYIRLVDHHSGHWGHINFDDFKFYREPPVFPEVGGPTFADLYVHAGLSGEEAANAMSLPEGFRVTCFAAEPDVQQPIALALDDRGRLWVAEAYSYPKHVPDDQARDRVLIFEDEDGDGRFDRRTVFCEGLNLVSGLEVGFGGAWVGAAPNLLFIPDADGDDVPDGPPQVVLDGWGHEDTHETLNAFLWGPDGWLYGCHGVFTHSNVGPPGTPDEERTPIDAGIWRYHPQKKRFEVFAHGTSNPWGVDFDDRGQAFATACVIPHLFHVIQGARYQRQAGEHFNRHTYADIATIADHLHYLGNQWRDDDRAGSDTLGGGHAHAGAMIYLGGKWPADYRGRIFMSNIHGQRVNVDLLHPQGSGFVGTHGDDFLLANDQWSQVLNFRYGPDGDVYAIDWYDKQACHTGNPEVVDRTNGRIFKITYVSPTPAAADLRSRPSQELVDLQLSDNDWHVRHARRILQERGPDPQVHEALGLIAYQHTEETRRLRALWALHATGGAVSLAALEDPSPYVRGWAIQLLAEDFTPASAPPPDVLERLNHLARHDDSPVVRLYLASAAQRIPLDLAVSLLAGLVSHAEDAADHNLPLMYWYGLEPIAAADPAAALAIAEASPVPMLLPFTVRRVASLATPEALALVVENLGQAADAPAQLARLEAVHQAFEGRRQVPMPANWSAVYARLLDSPDETVRSQSTALAVTFGDRSALAAVRRLLTDANALPEQQLAALDSLVGARDAELPPTLHALLDEPALRGPALRALAAFDDEQTPSIILARYADLAPADRSDALATLAARVPFALALLDAVEAGQVAPGDLSAEIIRQLGNLGHADVDRRIGEVWGIVRQSPEEIAQSIADYKELLSSPPPTPPDLMLGRALFAKTCQQCHTLFGTGGKVGPELTGSNRANLDYLLSNILDPSAVMAKEYQPSVIETTDGRILTGIVRRQDGEVLTVQLANETVSLPASDVEQMHLAAKSMMPDDILKPLGEGQVRALAAYLAGPHQVPLLATADNLPAFFNGRDLTGWRGNADLWRVEEGQIVGRGVDLARNEFLASELALEDFRLTLEVLLVDNLGNSGIQFRSELLEGGEVRGYQADIGVGWWGKLYEEHGRGLLWAESGEAHVRPGEWNTYEIVAQGGRVRTWINGRQCVDLDDPPGARRGVIAFQLHAGGTTEVRFKDLDLKLLEPQQATSE